MIVHHMIVQESVDQDVMAALQAKSDTQETLMQALKARIEKVRKS